MATDALSVLNKLTDVTVDQRSFTNKDTSEIIEYTRLLLHVEFEDGSEEVVEFKSAEGNAAYKLLKAAKVVE